MRTYLVLIGLIVGMLGLYVALLPLAAWSDAKAGIAAPGPF